MATPEFTLPTSEELDHMVRRSTPQEGFTIMLAVVLILCLQSATAPRNAQ